MKKAFFRILGLILGLNVFTACYGPAPGQWEYNDAEQVQQNDQSDSEESGEEGESESSDKA